MATDYSSVQNAVYQRQLASTPEEHLAVHRSLHCSSALINRIALETTLEGHNGCVNCLEWSADGQFLVSGSDDLHALLWDIDHRKEATRLYTGHTGNIFSVKFVPDTNNCQLLSCADDRQVRYHDLVAKKTLNVWSCSRARVKRLATVNTEPHLVWSASEDGIVRQYDLRHPHTCGGSECRNAIIDVHHISGEPQCKCIDVNQVRTEVLAIGCNDPYVRLYDRRILSPGNPQLTRNMSSCPSCMYYVAPGHITDSRNLQRTSKPPYSTTSVTYVNFSPDGTELLVNMSDEQLYLYSLVSEVNPIRYDIHKADVVQPSRRHILPVSYQMNGQKRNQAASLLPSDQENQIDMCEDTNEHSLAPQRSTSKSSRSATVAQILRKQGNDCYKAKRYFDAVQKYSEAISVNPTESILYANRAAAFLARKWEGDIYDALRDCETAVDLDPSNVKAEMRRITSLAELEWTVEAQSFFEAFSHSKPKGSTDVQNIKAKMDNILKQRGTGNGHSRDSGLPSSSLQAWEKVTREKSRDFTKRFCGHWNAHTDIKEASFLGQNGAYVAAGSDDGNVFIWEKKSSKLVRILKGDSQIVNCIQWNPCRSLMATSGIEHIVRLWQPKGLHNQEQVIPEGDFADVCKKNQSLMHVNPYAYMLMHMGYRIPFRDGDPDNNEREEIQDNQFMGCRQS